MDTSLFLLLIFLLLAVLVVFTIPLLLRLKNMLNNISELIVTTNESIKPLLSESTETIKKANSIIGTIDETLNHIKDLSGAISEVGSGIKKVGVSLKGADEYISNVKGQVAGVSTAVKTTLNIISKGLFKKKEEKENSKNTNKE